jgi:hypothetical protein
LFPSSSTLDKKGVLGSVVDKMKSNSTTMISSVSITDPEKCKAILSKTKTAEKEVGDVSSVVIGGTSDGILFVWSVAERKCCYVIDKAKYVRWTMYLLPTDSHRKYRFSF